MTGLPLWQVDAFADAPFGGNPACVLLLDRWRPDAALQRIAAELAQPATAFVVADAAADDSYEVRWFSPAAEIVLCGHGTLAAAHALIGVRPLVRLATREAGVLTVARDGAAYRLSLPAIPTEPAPLAESAAAMGAAPLETRWNARGYALLRYADEAAVRALAPDPHALAARGPIQHIATAPGAASDIVSRVFSADGREDAATGSAHAVLTPYWATILGRSAFTAVQASARGARLDCRLDDDRVLLTGRCVTVAEGRLQI